MNEPNWEKVDPVTVDFILAQGEKYLATQWASTLAADQRALTASSVFGALGTALIAVSFTYWIDKNDAEWEVFVCGVLTGAIMIVGSLICLYSGRPRDFYSVGAQPKEWYEAAYSPLPPAKGVEAQNYQYYIEKNNAVLIDNANTLQVGLYLAAASPLIGLLVWAILAFLLLNCI